MAGSCFRQPAQPGSQLPAPGMCLGPLVSCLNVSGSVMPAFPVPVPRSMLSGHLPDSVAVPRQRLPLPEACARVALQTCMEALCTARTPSAGERGALCEA